MDEEDFTPRAKKFEPPDLSPLSVGELNEYIAELEGEIARVRADIAAKETHRKGVEGLFRS